MFRASPPESQWKLSWTLQIPYLKYKDIQIQNPIYFLARAWKVLHHTLSIEMVSDVTLGYVWYSASPGSL